MTPKTNPLLSIFRELITLRYIFCYAFAALLTYCIVASGADWNYNWYVHTYINTRVDILGFADGLGFFAALSFCLIPALAYFFTRRVHYKQLTVVVLYVLLVGLSVSTAIKVFAGRESPPHFHPSYAAEGLLKMDTWEDNSTHFQFGFMREQVFGGYPSSHATLFFAFASTYLLYLRARRRHVRAQEVILVCILYALALFISIGVSFGHHWLSESVAGAVLGVCIGHAVAKHIRFEQN